MRKSLVAGNWKMHGTVQSVTELSESIKAVVVDNIEVLVCPSFPFLSLVADRLTGSQVALGAQNISEYAEGAYTGEVSGSMLAGLNCQYAIVGHSERRTIYGESNSDVANKFVASFESGVTPILCVGETLEQREAGTTLEVIAEQLQAVIDTAGIEKVCKAVVAYEPVWAIGTGKTATPEQAQDVHAAIRKQLGETGDATRILYGGSVKASNAAEIFAKPDIDGALVGGASLKADEFIQICQQAGS